MKEFHDIHRDDRFMSAVPLAKPRRVPVVAFVVLLGLLSVLYGAAIAGVLPQDTFQIDQEFGLTGP